MRPHPKHARTSPTSPRAWGASDRNGFQYNHENLQYQYQWAGMKLINQRILVGPDELDIPQEQLRTIIFPPDPQPIMNARPEGYSMDESTFRTEETGRQRFQLDGTARVESNLQGPNTYVSPQPT